MFTNGLVILRLMNTKMMMTRRKRTKRKKRSFPSKFRFRNHHPNDRKKRLKKKNKRNIQMMTMRVLRYACTKRTT